MKSSGKFLLALAASITMVSPALAQVKQAATGGGYGLSVFGDYSYAYPNFYNYYLEGVTAGAFVQRSRWIGGEIRGSALQWGQSPLHQSSILVGPRAQYTFHRLAPYGAFEVGITHVVVPIDGNPSLPLTGSDKFSWQIIGGVDYRINHRWSVRAGEFSYGKIYVLNGLNPKSFSAGVVYRVF